MIKTNLSFCYFRHTVPVNKKDHLRMRIKQGRLFMIDLAGSERANKTKNRGKRLQEGAHINRYILIFFDPISQSNPINFSNIEIIFPNLRHVTKLNIEYK